MEILLFAFLALVALLLITIGIIVMYYNRFVKIKNQVDESWSGIDVQLIRRYDLIPNLVETVKGYAGHERETLEKVIQARNIAVNAKGVEDKAQADNILTGALKSIFALAEAYPELKANQNFLDLQATLKEIEDNLQLARRYYNAVVRDFNILCESFPSNLIAAVFRFTKREFFEAEEAERKNVQVKF